MKKSWLLRTTPEKKKAYAIRDVAPDRRETYFFFLTFQDKEQAFLMAVQQKARINIKEFGRVLASGYGKPSAELIAKMQDEYGISWDSN